MARLLFTNTLEGDEEQMLAVMQFAIIGLPVILADTVRMTQICKLNRYNRINAERTDSAFIKNTPRDVYDRLRSAHS